MSVSFRGEGLADPRNTRTPVGPSCLSSGSGEVVLNDKVASDGTFSLCCIRWQACVASNTVGSLVRIGVNRYTDCVFVNVRAEDDGR